MINCAELYTVTRVLNRICS